MLDAADVMLAIYIKCLLTTQDLIVEAFILLMFLDNMYALLGTFKLDGWYHFIYVMFTSEFGIGTVNGIYFVKIEVKIRMK